MNEKLKVTENEIEMDIRHSLMHPPQPSEKSYRRKPVLIIAAFALVVVMAFFFPWVVLGCLIVFLLSIPAWPWIRQWYLEHKKIKVSDYQVTKETVYGVVENTYIERRRNGEGTTIYNYYVQFQNGKLWAIPMEVYAWTKNHRMSCRGVFEATRRDDTMIVVASKRTGKIVMAYPMDTFEYVD